MVFLGMPVFTQIYRTRIGFKECWIEYELKTKKRVYISLTSSRRCRMNEMIGPSNWKLHPVHLSSQLTWCYQRCSNLISTEALLRWGEVTRTSTPILFQAPAGNLSANPRKIITRRNSMLIYPVSNVYIKVSFWIQTGLRNHLVLIRRNAASA